MGNSDQMIQIDQEHNDEFESPFWKDDFSVNIDHCLGLQAAARLMLSNERIEANPEKFRADSKKAALKFMALLAKI